MIAADLELVGREDELRHVRELVSALLDGPRGLTLRGEAGIGKTSVWRVGVDSGRGDRTLLSARCVEAELPLALVGLSDLIGEVFGAVAGELTTPDRDALAAALGLAPTGQTARDAAALPRGFLALLRSLARDKPVLIAVDDVQWLDDSSAKVLAFAVRRLEGVPVGILVTTRGDGPDPLDLANALGADRHQELLLRPLSLGAIRHVVSSRFDVSIPRPVLARVHKASNGNPMFALEFARSLAGKRGQLGPIAIPSSLVDLVRARLERCPEGVRHFLAIVFAADRPTLPSLTAVDANAPELLATSVDLDAVMLGDDGLIRFTHPLLGSAAYGALTGTARRSLHAELAHASHDTEERARHLALATVEPDSSIAALLDEAAALAMARGAPAAAAELAREALRLTPHDDPERVERTIATAWRLSGGTRFDEAFELLDQLLGESLEERQRAEVLLTRIRLSEDLGESPELIESALACSQKDASLHAQVLLMLSATELYRENLAASATAARRALATAEVGGDEAVLAAALMTVADRADLEGRPESELLERAAGLAGMDGLPEWWPREFLGRQLLRKGDLAGARERLEPELTLALEQGAQPDRYRVWRDLADLERHAGRWELSEHYVEEAAEYTGVRGARWGVGELMLRRAAIAAARGRVDEAHEFAAKGIAGAEAIRWPHLAALNRWVLGFVELSLEIRGGRGQRSRMLRGRRPGAGSKCSMRSPTPRRHSWGSAASARLKTSCRS